MIDGQLKAAVMSDLVLLSLVGIRIVLVHGGGPEINEALRAVGVTEVDVVGLAESHCVACTAVDAVRAGFPTRVLRELTAPVSEELGAQAREWMMTEGVLLV